MAGNSSNYERNGKKEFWITTLIILVIVGCSGYGVYAHVQNKKKEKESAENLLPPITRQQFEGVKEGIRTFGRVAMGVTPEQEKKIEAIWTHPPRNLDEVKEFERKTDEILTPAQRQIVQPFRTAARYQVIDQVIEPAKKSMSGKNYEVFRRKIQERVNQRLAK